MSRLALASLAFAAIIFCAIAKPANETPPCRPERQWNPCGSSCPPTCDNPNRTCEKKCVPRCECRDNMLEYVQGRCIPYDAC